MNTVVNSHAISIAPSGYINAANATEFQEELTTAVGKQGISTIVVDMAEVEFIDSAGLMALVTALRLAKSLRRQLFLRSVGASIRIVLELSQLDRAFEILDSPEACETSVRY
ncbi:STAS domain-containing protein [Oscillatoria salina]|uniref:STAS domain-containing protein n=1 Tax=Oscillatoria salina TaxID=331517 RepID=UPI0013BBF23C|nr:STAS domain-containing protein [Oscillatoria salina]MBZ8180335.1 STAS domain-containing protein [Oscillatoria salina IIICB1]NET88633.1 STAS domain-containing protein [Kamptonema sp. SIO1D9]